MSLLLALQVELIATVIKVRPVLHIIVIIVETFQSGPKWWTQLDIVLPVWAHFYGYTHALAVMSFHDSLQVRRKLSHPVKYKIIYSSEL